MNKVEELEKKWFNYKVKKTLKPLMRLSLFSLVVGGSYYLYDSKSVSFFSIPLSEKATNVLGVSLEANSSIQEKPIEAVAKTPVVKEKPEVEVVEQKEILDALALAPIIPVIDMEKEERIRETKRRAKPKNSSNVVAAKPNTYLTAKELAVISKSERRVESVPHKTKKMKFETTSVNYLDTIKEKFRKSKNPREAVILSRSYYKSGQYKEAEKWALSANKLDSSLEESWLLFAKSKAKLGKKEEALKILVSYYKKSQSDKAKRVIGQIKTGKI